jgi:ParB-like chromosome segregation protein Spo0J
VAQGSRNMGADGLVRTVESVADMKGSPDLAGLTSPRIVDGFPATIVATASLKTGYTPRLGGEDLDHVKALAEVGDCWPPILVHRQTMRVIDGMHRLRAARLRGQTMIEVLFFDGDESEAFVAAVKANVAHGLPLTLADRKAAATRIIGSQQQRSDRWIGEVTGLSAGTVSAIRHRMSPSAYNDTARIGRDGRVRPIEMAEGRRKAQEQITSHPDASLREIARTIGVSPATVKDVRDRMRRGEDPVPRPRASRALHAAHVDLPGISHDDGEDSGSARDLAWLLRQLGKDPSVRYTESGRTLLRWLEAHACGPNPVAGLIDMVPAHCGYLIADIARKCAHQWQELATALEQRLNTGQAARRERPAAVADYPS